MIVVALNDFCVLNEFWPDFFTVFLVLLSYLGFYQT